MGTAWINPDKAKMPKQEQDKWISLMMQHHPGTDWRAMIAELNEKHAERTGRKSKKN